MHNELLRKYAKLIINIGVNVQTNQDIYINCPVEAVEFGRLLAEEAYNKGARTVTVKWVDAYLSKLFYEYSSDEALQYVPEYSIAYLHEIVDKGGCVLSITSPNPEVLKDADPKKIKLASIASRSKTSFYSAHTMASHTQWCVAAYPNKVWAKKVFKDLEENEAVEKLLEAILAASRVTKDNDPVKEWEDHMDALERHSKMLNDYNFKELRFKNSLGTDLTIELVKGHIWAGGKELSTKDVMFAPNIPTEEVFTMPSSTKVNGTVVSTMPLNYNGRLIEGFKLVFKDGKVVEHYAEKGYEDLTALLDTDEGSRGLGEVALISHNSPISNMGILFYNTLFDENASCHLALGNAYPMNLVGGTTMTKEELIKHDVNTSMQHVDFMFGSSDMEVTGVTYDGVEVPVFRKGNFVF